MGRKKSPVTRNKSIDRRYVDPTSVSSLLGNVSPSSLRGLAAIKQEPTAMDTESSSDSLHLPNPPFQSLHRAMPIGGEKRERRQKNRRKRRSSGNDVSESRREEEDSSDEERQEEQVEMVTISVVELEKWQQRVIFHVEDHFSNEQLKRIAEFGRVHGTIMQEAQQYVGNMEMQLRRQFEEERTVLRAEANEFVAKTAKENESLRQQVKDLQLQAEKWKKQVDTLKQENGALKAVTSSKQEEARQGDSEQSKQTHSPPNNQTQVLPGKGEINRNVEDQAANNCQKVNGSELGEQENSHLPLIIKHVRNDMIDHCCAWAQTNSTLHHNASQGKEQLEQQQQPYTSPPNGTEPKSGVVRQDRNSQLPAASGDIRATGGTPCS